MTTIHVAPVPCGVCQRGMAPPGWPCLACAYAELATLWAELAAARDALVRYGRHTAACTAWTPPACRCDCGLDAAQGRDAAREGAR